MKKKCNILLVFFVLTGLFLTLCACAGGRNKSDNVGTGSAGATVNSGRPSSAEELLDVCVDELFFDKKINSVKNYVPDFKSSAAEKEYWSTMESVIQLLNDYGIEFYSYEIEDVYVRESDSLQTYDFDLPFVDYSVDTIVSYEICLEGDINVNKMNKNVDGYQEISEAIAEEGGLPQTSFLDVTIARRDGVWYFCTGQNDLETYWMWALEVW